MKKYIVVLFLGLLLTLAYAPFDVMLAAPISLSGLLIYLEKANTKKEQFIIGFSYGVGFFTSSLYWISASLFEDIHHFWWMVPFALLGLPMVISLFIGVLCVLSCWFKGSRIVFSLAFSALWVVIELIRSYALLPFPWNALGYISNSSLYIMQSLSLLGVYGLSLLFCIISTSFYTRSVKYIVCSCLLLGLMWVGGYYRVSGAKLAPIETGYTLRLVQPSILQHHMGAKQKQYQAMSKLIELSQRNLNPHGKYIIIWSEAAFPFGYYQGTSWHKVLVDLIPKDSFLITGLDRITITGENKLDSHNSIMAFANDGRIIGYYDKVMLVPFGEYIPLRSYLPQLISKVAYGIGDFIPGEKGKYLNLSEVTNILPLICYEGIFPYFIGSVNLTKIDIFLNITNDAWFGNTIGPYQHAAMVRARAVEFGKPIVRVANNGISFLVDPLGRVLNYMPLNNSAYLDVSLIHYKNSLTFYYKTQYIIAILIIGLLFACFMLKKKYKKK